MDWNYSGPDEIFAEIRKVTPSMAGITWERLEEEHSLTYPLENEGDPGEPVIFKKGFPTETGKARLVPAQFSRADELPDDEFPLVFVTSRQLEHWHTGSMTRRAYVLDRLEPEPHVHFNPQDLSRLGVESGSSITLESRRGKLSAFSQEDSGVPEGSVFMSFAYNEAAANLITSDALDPFGKIAEVKYCAVRITPGGAPEMRLG